jgi:hypothetical protein
MSIRAFPKRGELAHRISGELEITLYWNEIDRSTGVEVRQRTTGERVVFDVPRAQALDAFYHPFAHLADAVSWVRPDAA